MQQRKNLYVNDICKFKYFSCKYITAYFYDLF